MAPILSAQELEALLARPPGRARPAGAPEVAAFSFDGPPPFAAALLERMSAFAGRIAEEIQHRLRAELRREIGFAPAGLEIVGSSGAERLASGGVRLAFEDGQRRRLADLALDVETALALVEARLGGALSESQPRRPPTPVECALLARLMTQAAGGAVGRLAGAEGASACRVASDEGVPGSGFAALRIQISVEGRGGPAVLLASASRLADGAAPARPKTAAGAARGVPARRLVHLPVRLVPRIPGGAISLTDLMELRPGQVVRLDHAEGEPIELLGNGESLLEGRLVRAGAAPAFEITAWSGASSPREEER